MPTRLQPVVDLLEMALIEVHAGDLEASRATAMSALANALLRVYQGGELEDRLRKLEEVSRD